MNASRSLPSVQAVRAGAMAVAVGPETDTRAVVLPVLAASDPRQARLALPFLRNN